MSDEELVAKALTQQVFFEHLVLRYEQRLSRYVRRLGVRTQEDVQDVLQNIFIKVYKNLNGFDTALPFSSWVYRIAHNEAVSWYRKRSVRAEGHLLYDAEDVLALLAFEGASAEKAFDAQINAQEISRALQELDQKYVDVLVLRFFEQKEYGEISDILKIPISSVGTLLHRGKRELQKKLTKSHLDI